MINDNNNITERLTINAADKIYITGGFNGQECMNTVECYDPNTNVWTLVTPMQTRRSGVSCIAYHECLYVIGGFNGLYRMSTGEKFDPVTNRWSPVVEMGSPRSNFAIEVLDDMIFVAGGFNGVTTIAQVECYNDRTDEWLVVCRFMFLLLYLLVFLNHSSAFVGADIAQIRVRISRAPPLLD